MRHCVSKMLMVFLLCLPIMARAQENESTATTDSIDRLAPDFVTASICIADPTDWHDDLLGVLGHAFIRLQCPTFDLDYCFSYEGQSANDDFMGFVKGNLKMGLFAAPTQEYIQPYREWKRSIHEYTLNLPPEAELRLWEIMDNHLKDGVDLPLDLTAHGCTQTLVEYITLALDTTEIVYAEWPDEFKMTRSEILDYYLDNYPWLRLMAKCLGMYGDFDEECPNDEKIIMPTQLVEVWQKATVDGQPLLTYKGDLTEGESPVVEPPFFTPLVAGVLLVLTVLVVAFILLARHNKKLNESDRKAHR